MGKTKQRPGGLVERIRTYDGKRVHFYGRPRSTPRSPPTRKSAAGYKRLARCSRALRRNGGSCTSNR